MYAPIQRATVAVNGAVAGPAAFVPIQGPGFHRMSTADFPAPVRRGAVAQVVSPQIAFDPSTPFGKIQHLLNGRLNGWPQGQTWQTQIQLHGQLNQMTVYGTEGGVAAIVHQRGAPQAMINPSDPCPSYSFLFTPSGSPGRPVAAQWNSGQTPMNLLYPGSSAALLRLGGNVAVALTQSPYLPVANFHVPVNPTAGQGNGLADMPLQRVMNPIGVFGAPQDGEAVGGS